VGIFQIFGEFSMTRIKPSMLSVAFAFGGSALLLSTAFAQQQPAQKQERIEVTGSNVKRVDAEAALPVQIITREEIRRSGKQTVTELLRELPSNAAGGLTELTGSASFSAGAASASLRGLGSTATLVLLNGRRVAPYGLADPNFGQGSAVNLNAIPLDVVERIEVLKDGASAIYGSEAIAGVINIILRKDFKGAQVSASGTQNGDGQYGNRSLTGTFGFGDLGKDRFNVFGNVEIFRSDSTKFKDVEKFLNRDEYRNVYLTGVAASSFAPTLNFVAGSTFTPGAGCPPSNLVSGTELAFRFGTAARGSVCAFDIWDYVEITPRVSRDSVFGRGTFSISDSIDLFAEASYTKNSTYFIGPPRTFGQGAGSTFVANTGRLVALPASLPVGHPNNPSATAATNFRGRAAFLGGQDNQVESETTRVLVGAKGVAFGWDFETGFLFNEGKTQTTNFNEISIPAFTAAVANRVNLVNPTAAQADAIRINATDNAKSSFTVLDLKGSREVFALPGGSATIATGLEFRREEREVDPDPRKPNGEIFGRGVARAKGSRNVTTLFGELIMPVASNLEVQLAGRYDKYSDFGNSTTPKIAASWKPTSNLKLRGSYAEGFRAPSLTEASTSAVSGFFNGVDDPRRCNRAAGITVGCGLSIPGLIVGFNLLKPEESKSHTVGLVFEPTRDTSISLDYFNIRREKEIAFLSLGEILLNEGSTDPRYANRVVRDPANTNAAIAGDPGAILYVSTGFDNLGFTQVNGFDLDARSRISLGENGRLNLRASATYYTTQEGSGAPGVAGTSYNGFRNGPRWRSSVSASWERGNFTTTLTANLLAGFKPFANPESLSAGARATAADCANVNNSYLGICDVKKSATYDIAFEYRGIKNLRLNGSIRNFTNRKPSVDPLARPFNTAWYSPAGRLFNLGATYTFY
jgi:iron complex outermembrane recepter protein